MSKLTKWEAGQELIKACDAVRECYVELRDAGYIEEAAVLAKAANLISKHFNKFGSHEFGLGLIKEPSHD